VTIDSLDPKRYEISTVDDFLKIPPDRLDDFFADLKAFLEVKRELAGYFEFVFSLAEAEGESFDEEVNHGPFIWIDDGKPIGKFVIEFIDTEDGGLMSQIRAEPEESG
jgi:hypothetical protein